MLHVDDPEQALRTLKRVRQHCQTRVVQLSTCRVCGEDQREFERAVTLLKDLEQQLESHHVQILDR